MSLDWNKIAKAEFDSMPSSYKSDWKDLRQKIM